MRPPRERRTTLPQPCQGSLSWVGMRDYLAATRERVVVFDGSMGATLEQFDLSLEHDYKLPGRAHEALVLNRPDVIRGPARVDGGGRRRGRGDRHVPGVADQARRVGPRRAHLRDQPQGGRDRAPRGRRAALRRRARSARPATSRRPTTRRWGGSRSASSSTVFEEQARGLVDGGADLLIIETAQDILEVKAAVFGAREAFKATGRAVPLQTSVSLLPNGGKMLLGTDISAVLATLEALKVDVIGLNCSTGPEDMRDAIRFLGEFCPVPVQCIPNAGIPHQGPERRDDLPRGARHAVRDARRVRRALRRLDRRRLLRHHHGAHRRDRRARRRPRAGRAARAAPAARLVDDDRDAARPGPGADARRRARQLAGLAQGQGDAAGRRLRRPRRRSPRTRSRAARTCSTCASR